MMHRRLMLPAAALAWLALPSAGAFAAEPAPRPADAKAPAAARAPLIDLGLKFRQGMTYERRVETRWSDAQDVGTVTRVRVTDERLIVRVTILAVDQRRARRARLDFERHTLTADPPLTKAEGYDLTGQWIVVDIDKFYRVDIVDRSPGLPAGDRIERRLADLAFVDIQLPKKPARVGGSWDVDPELVNPYAEPFVGARLKALGRFEGLDGDPATGRATLAVAGVFTTTEAQASGISFLNARVSGHMEVDLATGRAVKATEELTCRRGPPPGTGGDRHDLTMTTRVEYAY